MTVFLTGFAITSVFFFLGYAAADLVWSIRQNIQQRKAKRNQL